MLVDVQFKEHDNESQSRYNEICQNIYPDQHGPWAITHPTRLDTGLYICHHGFERKCIEKLIEDEPVPFGGMKDLSEAFNIRSAYQRKMNRLYSQKYNRGPYRDFVGYGAYGLCDSPEQLLAVYPHFADDDVKRVITFSGILREDQPSSGGFRYHKNGTYVGRQKPRNEYLYDDKHIDMICSFHVYRIED